MLHPEVEVTSLLSSNMIKAHSIAYDKEKIKALDMASREDRLLARIRELYPEAKIALPEPKNEFVQGLPAETITVIEEVPPAPEFSEQDIEAMKESLREEIAAEMRIIYQQQGEEILANARAQAQGILVTANHEAEIAKESIFKLASAQGYEEGMKRAKKEEDAAVAALEAKKRQLQQEYERQIAQLEPAFADILIELVKKVTSISYENRKEILYYLIETGLDFAQKDTQFDVILSENDYQRYSELFPSIKEHFQEKFILEFRKDVNLLEGSCKLENENRVIDCGLRTRLEGLLEDLSLLGA